MPEMPIVRSVARGADFAKVQLRSDAEGTLARFEVSQPTDAFEIEADSIVDRSQGSLQTAMVADVEPASLGRVSVQRADASDEGEADAAAGRDIPEEVLELLNMKQAEGQSSDVGALVGLESKLSATRGLGFTLPRQTRRFAESKLGFDFGSVRLHVDAESARLSRSLGAHAFTVGNDVYFGAGQYAPESAHGKWLIAHELTHVVQQNRGLSRKPVQARLAVGVRGDAFEREADRVADQVTTSTAVSPSLGPADLTFQVEHPGIGAISGAVSDLVGLASSERIQGGFFGGPCVAEYWNLAAATTALCAAAATTIGMIVAPEPTTITKWIGLGLALAVISGIAWTINAIVSLVNCLKAANQPDSQEEIKRLERRIEQLEKTRKQIEDMRKKVTE